eukprot:SAG31_NODE_14171_length_823_cov_9.451657_1_plen_82_part_00
MPSLSLLTALTTLNLYFSTHISGTIPESLGLTALTDLILGFTHISGTIPDSLGLLTALTTLRLGEYVLDCYLWISKHHPFI